MLCKGGALGSKKPPQFFWQAAVGGSCPLPLGTGGCRIKPAGLGAAGKGDAQEGPCPSGQGETQRGTGSRGTVLTGSPLLPRAPAGPSATTVSPCMPEVESWG